jgi:hypothetical protein
MTKPSGLPSGLVSIRDAAIDYAIGRVKTPPENIDALNDWFNSDGWDALVEQGAFEDLAVDIISLAYNLFNDQELEAWEGMDPADINDVSRVKFARTRIENVFDEDEFLVKSVRAALLENDVGETAVIGATLESHGQGGMEADFWGVFKTFADFQESIRKSDGLVLMDDCPKLPDEYLLKLWNKET